MENEIRRNSGMFKPGVSGNPTGRPKSDATIKELARKHTEDAIRTLYEITQNKKAPHSARVHAACALLDRGWGKPTQSIESTSVQITYRNFLENCRIQDAEEAALEIINGASQVEAIAYNPLVTYESILHEATVERESRELDELDEFDV